VSYNAAFPIDNKVFRPAKARSLVVGIALFLFLLAPCAISATDFSPSNLPPPPSGILRIPAEYGEIIYRHNEGSPNQLFVIAISHRDSFTRRNGIKTARVQAEVYKVGEWLIRNKGLELLLPEGFFKAQPEKIEKERRPLAEVARSEKSMESLDLKVLEKELGDNSTFINAEMLLKRNYPLCIEQVDDRVCYDAVSDGIQKLVNCGNNLDNYLTLKSELDYLQDVRTAAMLQKIPGIIEEQFQQGRIGGRKALLTIGLYHIRPIIKYLDEKRIVILPPIINSVQSGKNTEELNLVKANFGVSIILPRTLVDDPEILKASKLDKVIADCRK
jgi:hypothetical protein